MTATRSSGCSSGCNSSYTKSSALIQRRTQQQYNEQRWCSMQPPQLYNLQSKHNAHSSSDLSQGCPVLEQLRSRTLSLHNSPIASHVPSTAMLLSAWQVALGLPGLLAAYPKSQVAAQLLPCSVVMRLNVPNCTVAFGSDGSAPHTAVASAQGQQQFRA
jgi:hypothetical protein